MKSFKWNEIDERGRYEVWSLHMEVGGKEMTYPAFCDMMDEANSKINH